MTTLQNEGVLSPGDISGVRDAYKAHLEDKLAQVSSFVPEVSMLEGQWKGLVWPGVREVTVFEPDTGVEREVLEMVGKASIKVPEGFVSICVLEVFDLLKLCFFSCRRSIPSCRDM